MSNNNTKKLNSVYNPCNIKNPYSLSEADLPKPGAWATLWQWSQCGFSVNKGEHPVTIEWTDKNGNPRKYGVFHFDQCHLNPEKDTEAIETMNRMAEIEAEMDALEAVAEIEESEPEIPETKSVLDRLDDVASYLFKVTKQYETGEIQYEHLSMEVKRMKSMLEELLEVLPEKVEDTAPNRGGETEPETEDIKLEPVLTKDGFFVSGHFDKGRKTQWVDGYTFEIAGVSLGVRKQGVNDWLVYELTTGARVSQGHRTRKEAVASVTPVIIAKIKEAIPKVDKKCKRNIANAYKRQMNGMAAQGGR